MIQKAFTILGIILLVQCTSRIDTSIFLIMQKNPCNLPCWYYITPNLTSQEDLITHMDNFDWDIQAYQIGSNSTDFSYTYKIANGLGRIGGSEGIVHIIQLPPNSLELQNVIELIGVPDLIYISDSSAQFTCYDGYLVWEKDGIVAPFGGCEGVDKQVVINSNNEVLVAPETGVGLTLLSSTYFYKYLPVSISTFTRWDDYGFYSIH